MNSLVDILILRDFLGITLLLMVDLIMDLSLLMEFQLVAYLQELKW
jgi:hypothetical protein